MGNPVEKPGLTNSFDPKKCVGMEAVIDTGGTVGAVPKRLVMELGLEKIEDGKVKCAEGRIERKKPMAWSD